MQSSRELQAGANKLEAALRRPMPPEVSMKLRRALALQEGQIRLRLRMEAVEQRGSGEPETLREDDPPKT